MPQIVKTDLGQPRGFEEPSEGSPDVACGERCACTGRENKID
jgi:hypothetical protein